MLKDPHERLLEPGLSGKMRWTLLLEVDTSRGVLRGRGGELIWPGSDFLQVHDWGFPAAPPDPSRRNSLTQSKIQLKVKRDFKTLILKILARCFGHQIALKNHGILS